VSRDDPEARQGAIREVLKYVGKPHGIIDSLDPERIGEYLLATRRQRLVSGFGSFYRVQVDEAEPPREDELVIGGLGFQTYRVPRVCPTCGAVTTEDDWGFPVVHPRLQAQRLPSSRYYAWHPQDSRRVAS